MKEWQPIWSAPKDGTRILLRGGKVDTVFYDEDAVKPECVVGWHRGEENTSYQWSFCSFDGGTYGEYEEPTHWMSLPPADEDKNKYPNVYLTRLKDAVEGECGGLAIDDDQAHSILKWVLFEME